MNVYNVKALFPEMLKQLAKCILPKQFLSYFAKVLTSFNPSEALLQLLRWQQPGPRARHQVLQPPQKEVLRAVQGVGDVGAAKEEALLQQISGKAGEQSCKLKG